MSYLEQADLLRLKVNEAYSATRLNCLIPFPGFRLMHSLAYRMSPYLRNCCAVQSFSTWDVEQVWMQSSRHGASGRPDRS